MSSISALRLSPVSFETGSSTISSASRAGVDFLRCSRSAIVGLLGSIGEPIEKIGWCSTSLYHRTHERTSSASRVHHGDPTQSGLAQIEDERVPVRGHDLITPATKTFTTEERPGVLGWSADRGFDLRLRGQSTKTCPCGEGAFRAQIVILERDGGESWIIGSQTVAITKSFDQTLFRDPVDAVGDRFGIRFESGEHDV